MLSTGHAKPPSIPRVSAPIYFLTSICYCLYFRVSLETAPSWSQMRFYWASPKLQNVLIELFLAGRADTLQLIARAAVVSDLLPQMLDGLCEVSSVPSTKKDCQDLLDGTYDFCRWKDETIAQISADMPRLIGLLKNVTGMVGQLCA